MKVNDKVAASTLTVEDASSSRMVCIDTRVGIHCVAISSAILITAYIIAYSIDDDEIVGWANSYLPFGLIASHSYAVYRRIQHNSMFIWAPETWFFTYSAIQFGIGSLIYVFGGDNIIRKVNLLYAVNQNTLLMTNLLNSVTVFLVSCGFLLAVRRTWICRSASIESGSFVRLKKLCILFLVLSSPVVLAVNYKFVMLPGAVAQLELFAAAGLVILFFMWGNGEKAMGKWALGLLLALSALSVVSFGKAAFAQNFLYAAMGLIMSKKRVDLRVVFLSGTILVLLLVWYRPVSEAGRAEKIYEETLGNRMTFVVNYVSGEWSPGGGRETSTVEELWSRQSLNNVQAFLMAQYDGGLPGASFDSIWIYFIPRLIWPEKPITTNISRDLNELVFGYSSSALAPSFNGDAYWNGGWAMVVAVSIYIGAVFGVMSRVSIRCMVEHDFRYLPIAIMGINLGKYTEGFFANAFIGGVVIMLVWWYILVRILPKQ